MEAETPPAESETRFPAARTTAKPRKDTRSRGVPVAPLDPDLRAAVTLAYRTTLGRVPSGSEMDRALTYVSDDAGRIKGLAWLLFNLDKFIYVR